MEKRGQDVPVRLRLFEPLRSNKRPIYVVTQANEAIYVSLKPEQVYEWLRAVEVSLMRSGERFCLRCSSASGHL